MLQYIADYLTYSLAGLAKGSTLGEAVNFFTYETVKILLLLTVIIFAVSVVRGYFPPERTKRMLAHRRLYAGNVLAALLGVVTPFCSCSAVPVFIGFVEAGVPLGVTFSFLVSSPMVNEVAVVLLLGMFGWKVALLYVSVGLSVAVSAGVIIGWLGLERWVEGYVFEMRVGEMAHAAPSFRGRLEAALSDVKEILGRIWPYVIAAIGIGAFIHGYAPQDLLVRYAGRDSLFAVPAAVAIGVPLYSNAAGIVPVVYALFEKGLPLGTVLAFMMAVTALSVPEMVILRKVLKPQMLGVFVGIMAVTIICVGYLFNVVL